jgi:hypothetical protein
MYKSILVIFVAFILALTLPLSAIATPNKSVKKPEKVKEQPKILSQEEEKGNRVRIVVTVPAKGKPLKAEIKHKKDKKSTNKIKKKEVGAEKRFGRFASDEETKTVKRKRGPQKALQVLREKLSKLPEVALKGIYQAISVIAKWFGFSFATNIKE